MKSYSTFETPLSVAWRKDRIAVGFEEGVAIVYKVNEKGKWVYKPLPLEGKLKELWSYKTGGLVEALAFSDNGLLGVASEYPNSCIFILDQKGEALSKICKNQRIFYISYSNDTFGFTMDGGYIYLLKGTRIWKEMHVGKEYSTAIAILPNGFIACGNGLTVDNRCAYFDFNENKKWDVDVGGVGNGPAVHNGYVYVADYYLRKLLILKLDDGSLVNSISYGENVWDAAVCGNYLAVSTEHHLYLYDLSDPTSPKELWNVGGFSDARSIAFSPDCKYIAASDEWHHKFKIFDVKGDLALEKWIGEYNEVESVAWWKNRIAIGTNNDEVYVYKLEGYTPFGLSSQK
jgi:WD40 repeat protein